MRLTRKQEEEIVKAIIEAGEVEVGNHITLQIKPYRQDRMYNVNTKKYESRVIPNVAITVSEHLKSIIRGLI